MNDLGNTWAAFLNLDCLNNCDVFSLKPQANIPMPETSITLSSLSQPQITKFSKNPFFLLYRSQAGLLSAL